MDTTGDPVQDFFEPFRDFSLDEKEKHLLQWVVTALAAVFVTRWAFLGHVFTTGDVSDNKAVVLWVLSGCLVLLFIAMSLGWRFAKAHKWFEGHWGYTLIGGKRVAGLAVRVRDLHQAGVILPAAVRAMPPGTWFFRILGDPAKNYNGGTVDYMVFDKLGLANEDVRKRNIRNDVRVSMTPKQLNHLHDDWWISHSDSGAGLDI
jgi:hypothetical protein